MIAENYGVPTGLGPDVCVSLQPCGQAEGDIHWQVPRRTGEAEGICKTADCSNVVRQGACIFGIFGEGERIFDFA